jgi:DNA-binding SARP family transcriptional activator
MRHRLRSRFLRAARSVGHQLERSGELAAAQALYERALEADSLAEEIYRGLMLCLEAQDRRAEALEVYRRCRHNLSVILGISPSAQTEAIYRCLLGG